MPLIQILSDLHLETYPSYGSFKLNLTDAPYIALLGDIGHVGDDALFTVFRELMKHYWTVFFLLGNHEPYQISMEQARARVRKFERQTREASSSAGRFVFLDQTRHDIDAETTVLGCTLFSHVPESSRQEVGSRMVDFRDTRGWTVDAHNAAHQADVEWLNGEVLRLAAEEPRRRVVIFTHHCPTADPRASDPRYKAGVMTPGFVTDLSAEPCWTSENVSFWAFGHTHYACDFVDEATGKKVLSNPVGYWQNPKVTKKADLRRESPGLRCVYELPEGRTIREEGSEGDDEEGTAMNHETPGRKSGLLKKLATSLTGKSR